MAKLFEEVLNGTVHSPSADILIHFACHCETLPPGAQVQPSGAPTSPQIGSAPRLASPRPTTAVLRNSSSSPTRTFPQGGSSEVSAHMVPASIRCHTLVLRTQPTLLEALLPSLGRPAAAGGPEAGGEPEAPEPPGAEPPWEDLPPTQGGCGEDSPPPLPGGCGDAERPWEVTVDDEPEVFLEMIKFVYLNTCHVEHSNAKALMHVADKYGIEDIVVICLQWMQDHFTAGLFYHFLTFELSSKRFSQLLRQSLLLALRSRRHFTYITEGPEGQWEQLQVPFVEALLSTDELPVDSEAEVLHLLARWAKGALARKGRPQCQAGQAQESPLSTSEDELGIGGHRANSQAESSESGCSCNGECAVGETVGECGNVGNRHCDQGVDMGLCSSNLSSPDTGGSGESGVSGHGCCVHGEEANRSRNAADSALEKPREDMLRLLRTFRKSDMLVKISDIEPILKLLSLNSLFSSKPPRETAALDPGFMIYRGVAGVNVPTTLGELNAGSFVPHAWRGGSVSLGSHDYLQQQDGFRPSSMRDGGVVAFPRLWVRITCSSWSHREKRTSKNPTGLVRHSMTGPLGGDVVSAASGWEAVNSTLLSMQPVSESGLLPEKGPPTLKSMQSMQAQDDWELGRKYSVRSGSSVPNISDNEKIDHKVVCAVISGHMRHGIRIRQHERNSIYELVELYGQCEEVCIGGSPTEVEFELQLTVQAPNHCGICRCTLAVLPSDGSRGIAEGQPQDPLLEVAFDASAEERLHFYISSSHFDSNSSYSVALNWALRPGQAAR